MISGYFTYYFSLFWLRFQYSLFLHCFSNHPFRLRQHPSHPSIQYGPLMIGGRYANPFPEYRPQTLYEFVYCRIIELFHKKPRGGVPADKAQLRELLPTHTPDFDLLLDTSRDYLSEKDGNTTVNRLSITQTTPHADIPYTNDNNDTNTKPLKTSSLDPNLPSIRDRLTLTWLGQSCAFIQMGGINVLTDPCFGPHLVNGYLGPKRITPPPCTVNELPKLDVVMVSHDHPDHLEFEAVEEIGNAATWIVPVGVGAHLEKLGVTNYKEMTWWERATMPGTDPAEGWEIACTPAMHWSGRSMVDSNSTLWCSFVVLRNNKPVFFHAGDTGYSRPLFEGIKNVFGGGMQVAMVPCGAYTPRWHLRSQHTNPEEAIQIMKDLGARKLVGVHWGTFVLSDEHFLEPRDRLHMLAESEGRAKDIIAPDFGKTMVFNLHDDRKANDKDYKVNEHEAKEIRDGKAILFD